MTKLSLLLTTAAFLSLAQPPTPAQQVAWTGSWAAAPVAAPAAANVIGPDGATYRDIVHLSLGGEAIRVRISNEFGASSLTVASTHVAIGADAGAIIPATDHTATFSSVASVTIPAGSIAVSDPIPMPVQAFSDLAVSLFVPAQTGVTLTYHPLAMSTNYVAAGNVAQDVTLERATRVSSWFLLKAIDVDGGSSASAVVILGASISDGYHSTPDKNLRWPDDLAVRLQTNKATSHVGVLNEGISGNRLLHDVAGPNALARLDRDVLAQPGAKYLILSIGTNDIGRTFFPTKPNETVTAEQIIWGYRQVVERAHARGIKVYATTLNPFGGAAYFSPEGEQMRQAANLFLKTSKAFDGIIDFDKATRDPAHPETLLPAFDSGDHLHPNDAGYKAMADAIDLKLFAK